MQSVEARSLNMINPLYYRSVKSCHRRDPLDLVQPQQAGGPHLAEGNVILSLYASII